MTKYSFTISAWIGIVALGILLSGCAYFNTMYNAQKKFEEAEREVEAAPQPPPASRPAQQGAAQPRPVPIEKYRKVIETSAKLLENHPKSRWVDDALLLMGISYYRINDFPRAEKKFSELVTLFPNSPHTTTAIIWKARVLAEQKRLSEAIELLRERTSQMKSGVRKAEALFLLGNLYFDMKQWSDAADQFQSSLQQKQRREQRYTALYRYGLALFYSGKYVEARDALSLSARASHDIEQSYNAHVYWSHCELALQNSAQAEEILSRVQTNERFLDFTDDIKLELADLASATGRVDDAIALYQDYIDQHSTGEGRGLAFYRLANIQRYQRMNLSLAKSLLDSVIRCGASREIVDSTRMAIDQISKGLLALENIRQLTELLDTLKMTTDSAFSSEAPKPSVPAITTEREKSGSEGNAQGEQADAQTMDTLKTIQLPEESDSSKKLSPAALAADSVLKSIRARQAAQLDSTRNNAEKKGEDVSGRSASVSNQSGSKRESRESIEAQLQQAYLLIAEFYQYNMADRDSALYYYKLAAASPLNKRVYWKANLFLAQQAAISDSSLSADAERRYRAVLETDSIPVQAANIARKALGLPLLEVPMSPQHAALRAAETARSLDQVSTDSLLFLYSEVIRLDSFSRDGRSALFAKAHLYENVTKQVDSARALYQTLLKHYQDSSFATWLEMKLSPPDSDSVFLRSDKELFSKREAVETLLQPAKTEDGWPPPEESLRGRRYR